MRKNSNVILAAAFALCLAPRSLMAAPPPDSSATARKAQEAGSFGIMDFFASTALKDNSLGEMAARSILVTLPPSYYAEPRKSYPFLYYLHGHGEGPGYFHNMGTVLARLMADARAPEMIIVEPDGSTRYGGGFYSNSPVTGNYEDYLVEELVAFIDKNYRTIAEAPGRALAGSSMGGYGALARGLGHPEVFSVAWAYAPGLFAPKGLVSAMGAWKNDRQFLDAYASVFSPTPGKERVGDIPKFDGSPADEAVIADWNSGFGGWDRRITAYLARPARLAGLKIAYGTADDYQFIKEGCEYLHAELDKAGIPNTLLVTKSDHRLDFSLAIGDLLPFAGERLKSRAEALQAGRPSTTTLLRDELAEPGQGAEGQLQAGYRPRVGGLNVGGHD